MTIEEQRRKSFEMWCKRTRPVLSTLMGWQPGTRDKYQNSVTSKAWSAWNAALDSVVIELPNPEISYGCMGEGMGDGWESYGAEEVREAIHAAGVKTK